VQALKSQVRRFTRSTDLIFPKRQRQLFKTSLEEQNLRFDRDGRPRTDYSLRHTYIWLSLTYLPLLVVKYVRKRPHINPPEQRPLHEQHLGQSSAEPAKVPLINPRATRRALADRFEDVETNTRPRDAGVLHGSTLSCNGSVSGDTLK